MILARRTLSAATPKRDYLGISVFLTIAAGTAGLGVWQTRRYTWKQEKIKSRNAQLFKEPVDVQNIDLSTEKLPFFDKVKLSGRFDLGNIYFVGPRSPPKELLSPSLVPPQGFYAFLPFVSENNVVMMNIGWVSQREHQVYLESDIYKTEKLSQETEVIALISEPEQSSEKPEDSVNQRHPRTYTRAELPLMLDAMNIEGSEYLTLVNEGNENISIFDEIRLYPKRKTLKSFCDFYVSPVTHAGYSITWFGLSLSALGIIKFRFL